METNDQPTFDLQGLVQGYVDDLRAVAQSPREEPAPSAGNEKLRASAGHVQAERDDAAIELNAQYRARTSAMEAVVAERQRRLEAYAKRQRQAVPADPNRFIVAGRVTDQATGYGLPHVRVRATDLDRRYDDIVGEARTDALGYYRIEYTAAAIDERDQNPETFIEVLDDEGEVLFTSTKSFIQKAGQSAFIAAAVDGDKLPTSQRMAGKVAGSVARRQQDLARRGRVLKYQPRAEVARDDIARRPAPQAKRAVPLAPKKERAKKEKERAEKAAARTAERVAPSPPLTAVKGIGAVYEERLHDAEVTDVDTVAAMEPSQLASILDVGTGRAERIIAAAQEARRV